MKVVEISSKIIASIIVSTLLNVSTAKSLLNNEFGWYELGTYIVSGVLAYFSLEYIINNFISKKQIRLRKLVESTNNYPVTVAILSDLKSFVLLPQLNNYFNRSWSSLLKDIKTLENGDVDIDSTLRKQFHVAESIADYYQDKRLNTIYATSLDIPSNFFSGNRRYFTSQQRLEVDNNLFNKFFEKEKHLYAGILYATSIKKFNGPKFNNDSKLPNKSRMVVISKKDMINDIKSDVANNIYKFINWHLENSFGLKFLIIDDAFGGANIDLYSKELERYTKVGKAKCIDDYIIYDSGCVFGRVDPQPGFDNDLSIRLILPTPATQTQIEGYNEFFRDFWNNEYCYSFGELFNIVISENDPTLQKRFIEILNQINK